MTAYRRLVTALILIVAAYAAVCLAAWSLQRRLMYFPGPDVPLPASIGLPDAKIFSIKSDGYPTPLRHWYIPSRRRNGPVVVHFHGNAGTIADRAFVARAWADAGVGVFLVEYPGYGGNPGAPSEESLYRTAKEAVEALKREGVAAKRWVLVGESLGSAVAVHLAKRQAAQGFPVGGVVLEAPFTSTVDVARRAYWFLPVRWLLRDRFPTAAHIARIGAPLLIVHGARDTIVPQSHGRALLAVAREPKRGAWIAAAGHNDLHDHGAFRTELNFVRHLFPNR